MALRSLTTRCSEVSEASAIADPVGSLLISKRTVVLGILTLILDLHSLMPHYRRPGIVGGTHFITQVTYQRQPWLCREIGRHALRTAIDQDDTFQVCID